MVDCLAVLRLTFTLHLIEPRSRSKSILYQNSIVCSPGLALKCILVLCASVIFEPYISMCSGLISKTRQAPFKSSLFI